MTTGAPSPATLAQLVRDCPFLDEASREYWLDVLPALDEGQRQRLADLLAGQPSGGSAASPQDDAAAGRAADQ